MARSATFQQAIVTSGRLLSMAEGFGVRNRPERRDDQETIVEWLIEAKLRRRLIRWCGMNKRDVTRHRGIWNLKATPLARRVLYNDMLRDRRVSG